MFQNTGMDLTQREAWHKELLSTWKKCHLLQHIPFLVSSQGPWCCTNPSEVNCGPGSAMDKLQMGTLISHTLWKGHSREHLPKVADACLKLWFLRLYEFFVNYYLGDSGKAFPRGWNAGSSAGTLSLLRSRKQNGEVPRIKLIVRKMMKISSWEAFGCTCCFTCPSGGCKAVGDNVRWNGSKAR